MLRTVCMTVKLSLPVRLPPQRPPLDTATGEADSVPRRTRPHKMANAPHVYETLVRAPAGAALRTISKSQNTGKQSRELPIFILLRGHWHALAPQMGMPCREPFLVGGACKAARFPPTETTLSRQPRGIDTQQHRAKSHLEKSRVMPSWIRRRKRPICADNSFPLRMPRASTTLHHRNGFLPLPFQYGTVPN